MNLTDMKLVYESPDGETIEVGPESVYRFGDCDLLDAAWSYELVNGTAASVRRDPRSSSLTLYVDAPTEAAGVAARNRLEDVLDAGVADGRLGRLRAGDWYTRCLCVAQDKDAWWFDGRYFEAALTLLRPDPVWTREQAQDYAVDRSAEASGLGKGYPFDYPYDYAAGRTVKGYTLDAREPAACRITVYGPAKSPYVWIGPNRYKVDVDVPDGGLLVVDGRDKTVELYDVDGNRTDAYAARQRGARGSGSYVFERIAPGYNAVSWDNSFGFEIRAYVERSSPEWTI